MSSYIRDLIEAEIARTHESLRAGLRAYLAEFVRLWGASVPIGATQVRAAIMGFMDEMPVAERATRSNDIWCQERADTKNGL